MDGARRDRLRAVSKGRSFSCASLPLHTVSSGPERPRFFPPASSGVPNERRVCACWGGWRVGGRGVEGPAVRHLVSVDIGSTKAGGRWLGWITADVALRLGKYFGMTPQFWMNLQADYDLHRAAATARLNKIKPRSAA